MGRRSLGGGRPPAAPSAGPRPDLGGEPAITGPVLDAVLENAAWCDRVSRAAGVATAWAADAWTAERRTPPGYPDAVTLRPGVDAGSVLARVEPGEGCSVKDSFADLDLAPAGFSVLFEATWIRRPPGPDRATALAWSPVRTAGELARWAEDEEVAPFAPAVLAEPGLRLFHAADVGAGFALSRRGAVVGVSHAWPGRAAPADLWADLVATAARHHPGLDLVGYERGDDLDHALGAGFTAVGPLRVWMDLGPAAPLPG